MCLISNWENFSVLCFKMGFQVKGKKPWYMQAGKFTGVKTTWKKANLISRDGKRKTPFFKKNLHFKS